MSKYIVTDELLKEIYPAETAYDVEQAVSYILGADLTNVEEIEFGTLIDEIILFDGPNDIGTILYPALNVSVRSTE